jgi:hypothetical protein
MLPASPAASNTVNKSRIAGTDAVTTSAQATASMDLRPSRLQ